MRLASWNINGLNARLDFVKHWLKARQPDIVGLQELKMEDDKIPTLEFEALGYDIASHGQKSWNGVAILARKELGGIEVTQRGLPGQEEAGARLITADVAGLSFTTIYCPNGKTISHEDFPRKLEWIDDLVEHTQSALDPDRPAVLCGDFNLCPEPIDSWNETAFKGHLFHTEEERARFKAFLDWGFVDLYRRFKPEDPMFSWWDYRAGAFHKNQGLRIDFLLGTAAVMSRVVDAEIDREYRKKKDGFIASDHAPVMIDIE